MSTTPTPALSAEEKALTIFEKVVLGILAAAPSVIPVFVHSQHGIVVANAGETLLANVLQQLATNK